MSRWHRGRLPGREASSAAQPLKMRIVFFQHAAVVGGASWCLLEIVRALGTGRHEIHVVMRERGPLEDALREWGCPVHHEPRLVVQMPSHDAYLARRDWPARLPYVLAREWMGVRRTAIAAEAWCRKLSPDVVHINTSALYPVAAGAQRAGVGRVLLHNREHWREYPWHPVRTRIKNRLVDRYVGRIPSITRTGAACFGEFGRTEIVRDWPSFDPRGRERNLGGEIGLAAGEFLVLVPGGQAAYKGSAVAMSAWNHVASPAARILFLGYEADGFSGRGSSSALAVVRPERRDSAHCLPRTIDMRSIVSQCHVVLSPFTTPHASKAVLDAGSLGVPSIVADCGEAREYVEDGRTGLIVPPGDPVALAAAIDRLVADRAAAAAMGRAACGKVAREFNRDRSMRQIEDAYAG